LAGSFYGVGIELGYVDTTIAVIAPLKDSPAAKAGVQAGDLIVHVKDPAIQLDQDTAGWTLSEAVDHIRGKKGTPITLTLFRKGTHDDKPFEVTVQRDEIIVKSVTLEFVEHNGKRVAHLTLSKFGERTESEWKDAVTQILAERKNIKGIVLDLRNNPGGFFDTSIQVASDFVKKDTIVTQESKFKSEKFPSNGSYRLGGIPLVVLVNRGSASAAEIVAGALHDDLGAKLIGEKTFGKGTVQDRRDLSNGGGLHITVAHWLLPKGSWIHKEGIPVDIEVKDNPDTKDDEVLFKGIETL
jgi:carboxyl-terminal processing protease